MELVSTIAELRTRVDAARRDGRRVGLVPTMGYLHDGHAALIRRARHEAGPDGLVVVSVFVNPLQFGPNEDLDRYPRDLDGDLATSAAAGADVVFHPSVAEMYPAGPPTTRVIVHELTDGLCGAGRPGHFEGVTTVVTKLFAACEADFACFGRKDAQQLAVVTRMAADLNLRTRIIPCPTMREPDGLALSSRNKYLDADDRAAAPAIHRSLLAVADLAADGERDPRVLEARLRAALAEEARLDVEYAELRDARTIAPLDRLDGDVLVAVAARCGTTRLIDNIVLHVRGDHVGVEAGEIQHSGEDT